MSSCSSELSTRIWPTTTTAGMWELVHSPGVTERTTIANDSSVTPAKLASFILNKLPPPFLKSAWSRRTTITLSQSPSDYNLSKLDHCNITYFCYCCNLEDSGKQTL